MRRLLFAAVLTFAQPALGCSMADEYRVPTNLELVEEAPLILIGKVEGGRPMSEDADTEPSIKVAPISALKGRAPAQPIEIEGLSLADDRFAVLSNPYELNAAHPLAYIGGCIRYMFPLGTTAVFFLEQREGKWTPAGDAFTRWAEDVPAPDAPWPRVVALYVRASQLPDGERRAFLEAERDALAARTDDPVARLMAQDISRQLAGPNKLMREQMFGGGEMAADAAAELVEEAAAATEAAAKAAEDAAKAAERDAKRSKRR